MSEVKMMSHIGTKEVLARPMNRLDYNTYRGWALPADEDGTDEGMLVKYIDGGKDNVEGHAGYVSWSPIGVFNNEYDKAETCKDRVLIEYGQLDDKFQALKGALAKGLIPKDQIVILTHQLEVMREYRRVLDTRLEGVSIADTMTFGGAIEFMKSGSKVARKGWNGKDMYATLMPGYPDGIEVNEITQKAHNLPKGTVLTYRPYYQLWTAQKDVAMWSPSTSDTLAEDWYIVEC